MKHLLLTTIAAVVLVGCGTMEPSFGPLSVAKLAEQPRVNQPDLLLLRGAGVKGDIEAVKQLVDAGTDLNVKDKLDNTLLHYAALNGRKEIAKLLIAEGADVNAKGNQYKVTPLHFAALQSHYELAELLIAKGADVNAKAVTGDTPLDFSISGKHPKRGLIDDLLRKHGGKTGEELGASRPVDKLLFAAVSEKKVALVKHAIKRGANVNSKYELFGLTPLHMAAAYDSVEIVKMLISNGANIESKMVKGFTPLHYAAEGNSTKVLNLLINNKANLNAKGNKGETPLHNASAAGNKEIAELLIKSGADINSEDNDGATPLFFATWHRRTETAFVLQKHGGEIRKLKSKDTKPSYYIQMKNCVADNLLLQAVFDRNTDEINNAINNGENINLIGKLGYTPIKVAILCGYEDIVRFLIKKGVNINQKDGVSNPLFSLSSGTPLRTALTGNNKPIAKILIENGADVHGKDEFGITPLHVAVMQQELYEVVELLIKKGVNINARNNGKVTPLGMAIMFNRKETATLLRKHGGKTGKELKAEGK